MSSIVNVNTGLNKIQKVPAIAYANNWFGKYKPEQEGNIQKYQVKEDEILKQLEGAFRKYKSFTLHWERYYQNGINLTKHIIYSSQDVTNFSIALSKFQYEKDFDDRAGFFLSALINHCKDKDFTILTDHLEVGIQYLGYKNTKNIVISGDIEGYLGPLMQSGKITISGNAGWSIGWEMKGGEIFLEGDYELTYLWAEGGNIYHKGKLIFKDGVRIF